jgi:transposase-like protein
VKQNNQRHVEESKEMTALVSAYCESGLGLKRFAQENGISPSRLHYWVYQKSRDSKSRSSARDPKALRTPGFQEVKIGGGTPLMESWAAEVRLAGGLSVRFSGTATPGWIVAVIQGLQGPC